MKILPRSRTQNIVVQEFNKELLLYNLSTNKVHSLNETAAIVYRACDGKTSFAEVIDKHKLTEEFIYFSIEQLEKEGLIEKLPVNYFGHLTRREVVRKVGLTSMMALPVVLSLVAPKAVSAQSCTPALGQSCTFSNYTQSDCCVDSLRCSDATSPNTCINCFNSGDKFLFAAPSADNAFCNAQNSKNLCCNSGLATGDGSWCYCP